MTQIEELGDFVRRVPVALYRTTLDGELLAANVALANLLGFETVEELRGGIDSVYSVYVDPRQRERWIEEITEAGVVQDFDVELRRPDGSTLWVEDTARAIRGPDGAVAYFEGALLDMTEKVRAQAAKDEFVATVSHELRNPIAVLLGLGEELAQNYVAFSDDERREMVQLIARQAEEASWLIEDLLVAFRADVGRVSINPQVFDITKETEGILEVVDAPIEVRVSGETTLVHADPRRTRQILRNLVSNSIRHGGEVRWIRIEPIGDRIEVWVSDTGPAIPPSEVERIFRPFETGTTTNHPRSVGLGLAVSRKLARMMEGDLTYRHDGHSSFVLSLPAA